MPRLILASTSPRRKELATLLGLPFEVMPVDVDETVRSGEGPDEMVRRLALLKARAVAECCPSDLVVTADTTVWFEGQILGKPTDPRDAIRMLQMLRGKVHTVYTGIAIVYAARERVRLVETEVWMRDFSVAAIREYVKTGDPLDKAAAYAVQHRDFRPVARVEGCFANVMGLPLCRLAECLEESGMRVPAPGLDCRLHPEQNCAVPKLLKLDH